MRGGKGAAQIGKGACVSIIFTLAAVLLFALAIKLFSIPSAAITPVNQVIKFLAVFLGCFFYTQKLFKKYPTKVLHFFVNNDSILIIK